MSILRNRFVRNVALAGAALGTAFGLEGLVARSAGADVIVPTVAATAGQHGSNWQSDLRVANPYSETISYTLVFTERGQSMSAADARVSATLGPNEVRFYPDGLVDPADPPRDYEGRPGPAGPPFKPCVRISRTRLADGLRGVACVG
ncbi:MAG: hypothetical protein M0000_02130 [Actinomycetota bacterium]|nr:hypothetical protein [Actinomycetota bacterium]